MAGRSSSELIAIAYAGGSVIVPADCSYSSTELVAIARTVAQKGGKLTVKGARKYSSTELVAIAQAAPGRVAFED